MRTTATRTITSLTAAAMLTAALGTTTAFAANAGARSTDGATSQQLNCRAVAVRVKGTDRHSVEMGVANRAASGCVAEEATVARTPGLDATGLRALTQVFGCSRCDGSVEAAAQISRVSYRYHGFNIGISNVSSWTQTTDESGAIGHAGESSIGRITYGGRRIGSGPITEPRTLRPASNVTIKLNRSYESAYGIRQVAVEVIVDRRSVLVLGEAWTGVRAAR